MRLAEYLASSGRFGVLALKQLSVASGKPQNAGRVSRHAMPQM